jgi:hypothetical protein
MDRVLAVIFFNYSFHCSSDLDLEIHCLIICLVFSATYLWVLPLNLVIKICNHGYILAIGTTTIVREPPVTTGGHMKALVVSCAVTVTVLMTTRQKGTRTTKKEASTQKTEEGWTDEKKRS